jgi:ribosome-binding factor A
VNHRRARLSHALERRLAEILEHRVSDPRLSTVSVIEVRAAPDASFARVFYRSRGDRDEVEIALEKAKPYIRKRLAEGLSLRRVPELDFRYDPSEESGARVDEILRELNVKAKDAPDDGTD